MARFMYVVMTNAAEGQDDAFNDWYTDRHLKDVLRLDGYVAAERFRAAPRADGREPPHKYLALYEVETDDLEATHAGLAKAAGTDEMPWHPAFDRSDVVAWYFQPIGERKVTE